MDETEPSLETILATVKPVLDASLDAVCVIDPDKKVCYGNLAARTLLKLKSRELKSQPKLPDLLKMPTEQNSQLGELLKEGIALRFDETPVSLAGEKARVSLRAVALRSGAKSDSAIVGAVVNFRDSTAEIVLQAKYHKVMEILAAKDSKIADLEERLKQLRLSLRKARVDSIS